MIKRIKRTEHHGILEESVSRSDSHQKKKKNNAISDNSSTKMYLSQYVNIVIDVYCGFFITLIIIIKSDTDMRYHSVKRHQTYYNEYLNNIHG